MAEIIQLSALLDRRHVVLGPLLGYLQWHPFVLLHLLIELQNFVICLLRRHAQLHQPKVGHLPIDPTLPLWTIIPEIEQRQIGQLGVRTVVQNRLSRLVTKLFFYSTLESILFVFVAVRMLPDHTP